MQGGFTPCFSPQQVRAKFHHLQPHHPNPNLNSTTGEVFCVGNGEDGQLGLGDAVTSLVLPEKLPGHWFGENPVEVMAAGSRHCLCATNIGQVNHPKLALNPPAISCLIVFPRRSMPGGTVSTDSSAPGTRIVWLHRCHYWDFSLETGGRARLSSGWDTGIAWH